MDAEMITLEEEILSLKDARAFVPRVGERRHPDLSTLYRWAMRGIGGVRLETIRVGGVMCTSREALQRFFNRDQAGVSPPQPAISPGSSELARIEKRLAEKGA